MFAININNPEITWKAATPECPTDKNCIRPNTASPLALTDLVFAGTLEGHISAHGSKTGKVLREFDTLKDYETTNGIPVKGGSLDGPSPVISGNMLFVNSGYGSFKELPVNVLIAFELEKR